MSLGVHRNAFAVVEVPWAYFPLDFGKVEKNASAGQEFARDEKGRWGEWYFQVVWAYAKWEHAAS